MQHAAAARPVVKRAGAALPSRSSKRERHQETPRVKVTRHAALANGIADQHTPDPQHAVKRRLTGAAAASHARKRLQQQEDLLGNTSTNVTASTKLCGPKTVRLRGAAAASHARKLEQQQAAGKMQPRRVHGKNPVPKPSPPASRELRTLLQDLGSLHATVQGPRKSTRPTFYNPSLQHPVVVLGTRQRAGRVRGHGGPGSPAHASLGHLGLVALGKLVRSLS